MATYYVKPDSKTEFPYKDTLPALESAEGLVAVDISATSVQYFTRYWWMYRLMDNGRVEAPGNLPSLDIDYLTGLVDKQAETIESLKDIAAQLGGAQAVAAVDLDSVKTATSELGGQFSQFMVANTTSTE
ncbi:hypothetical protein [Levilactobacillus enshiensis]|uniref:hypothetical protein n=1 Tax=Levilactobacillus enshiensis TaxID=2590213 RepID=UPI00117AB897|nr:hypothetical protein [Levilactobacillus enshiensis]